MQIRTLKIIVFSAMFAISATLSLIFYARYQDWFVVGWWAAMFKARYVLYSQIAIGFIWRELAVNPKLHFLKKVGWFLLGAFLQFAAMMSSGVPTSDWAIFTLSAAPPLCGAIFLGIILEEIFPGNDQSREIK